MELLKNNLEDDIPYIQAADLSREEFIARFRQARQPAVIKGAFEHWPCKGMDIEQLSKTYGDATISYRHPEGQRSGRFADLIQAVKDSKPDKPADYIRNIHIASQLPKLFHDITTPNISYVGENWKDSLLVPPHWLGLNRNLIELFVGGAGMSFPVLHIDYWGMDGFISQLYGRKEFLLLDPEQTRFLYTRTSDPLKSTIKRPFDQDMTPNPLYAKAKKVHLVLEPGDTLYNPGWWHTTQMMEPNVTIIQSVWHQDNWNDLRAEIARTQAHRPLRQLAYQLYLFMVYLIKSEKT